MSAIPQPEFVVRRLQNRIPNPWLEIVRLQKAPIHGDRIPDPQSEIITMLGFSCRQCVTRLKLKNTFNWLGYLFVHLIHRSLHGYMFSEAVVLTHFLLVLLPNAEATSLLSSCLHQTLHHRWMLAHLYTSTLNVLGLAFGRLQWTRRALANHFVFGDIY